MKYKEQRKRSKGDINYISKDFGKTLTWAPLESFGTYIDKVWKNPKLKKEMYPAFTYLGKPDVIVLAKKYFIKCSFCSKIYH